MKNALPVSIVVTLLSTQALAESVVINSDAGEIVLNSGSSSIFSDEVNPHFFTANDLLNTHTSLNSSGINTSGTVTIVLAETLNGLSMIALVDDETGAGLLPSPDSALHMHTSAPQGTQFFSGSDPNAILVHDSRESLAEALYLWDSETTGQGFSWSGLSNGDSGSFTFTAFDERDLETLDTIQFVSWAGGGWQLIQSSNFGEGSFNFSYGVVPLPAAFPIGLAGLGGVILWRRLGGSAATRRRERIGLDQ
jgi:hypothetical protein